MKFAESHEASAFEQYEIIDTYLSEIAEEEKEHEE